MKKKGSSLNISQISIKNKHYSTKNIKTKVRIFGI